MKNFILVLLFFAAVLPCFADTYVAVVETVAENGAIGRSERMFLTDKLRECAKKVLPAYMGYIIMTRENIQQMLPPEKKIEDCEGECLVETGKNINAHYIAQARVGRFGKKLTLIVELYEVMGNNLVGSFTAREADAEGLLDKIERLADGMFAAIYVGKKNIDDSGDFEGFIEDDQEVSAETKVAVNNNYFVYVSSTPPGAIFSVDGRPDGDCNETPCNVALSPGNHRFAFSARMYYDRDTTIEVKKSFQVLDVLLKPEFGVLKLSPRLQNSIGEDEEFVFELDGNRVSENELRLPLGKHHVVISHSCYESASFDVMIKSGSELTFDRSMQPLMGGLNLNVVKGKTPKVVSVYVNGEKVGKTPLLETIPLCSEISVGKKREIVPVELTRNQTVNFTYELSSTVSPDSEPKDYVPNPYEFDNRTSYDAGTGFFQDSRDGQTYRIVVINNRTWMAQNLNYKTGDSWCFKNKSENCKIYGRLYSWESANKACPEGWRLPKDSEFEMLQSVAGGKQKGGRNLKSRGEWSRDGEGTDFLGFAALPSGFRNNKGVYSRQNIGTRFWSSTVDLENNAYGLDLYRSDDGVYVAYNDKGYAYSVRCIQK